MPRHARSALHPFEAAHLSRLAYFVEKLPPSTLEKLREDLSAGAGERIATRLRNHIRVLSLVRHLAAPLLIGGPAYLAGAQAGASIPMALITGLAAGTMGAQVLWLIAPETRDNLLRLKRALGYFSPVPLSRVRASASMSSAARDWCAYLQHFEKQPLGLDVVIAKKHLEPSAERSRPS